MRDYDMFGWCRAPFRLSGVEIAKLRASTEQISLASRPEVVQEDGSTLVRAIHGCHRFDQTFSDAVRLPRLIDLAEKLIRRPVYVYQFKVNLKQPCHGGQWPWHQDYAFWFAEDGMPEPRAVNIAVLLDEVWPGNGPLRVVPGSHRLGLLDMPERERGGGEDGWQKHVSSDLSYTVEADTVARLVSKHDVRELVGPPGAVFAFHPSLVHSSPDNLSGSRRAVMLVTYNAVDNAPTDLTRPDFIVDRDTRPVVRLDREAL